MNAKHSAILLSGLLLLMIGIAWAQSSDSEDPTCPPLADEDLQKMLEPSAWVRTYWDANRSRWQVVCTQMDAIANMAPRSNALPMHNAAIPAIPGRTPARSNGNFVNTNAYNAIQFSNLDLNQNANANMPARNAANVRPPRSVRREPNTRRPGN